MVPELKKEVSVGTENREDLLLTLKPSKPGDGITVKIAGKGAVQFSEEIEVTVRSVLDEMNVTDVMVDIIDYWAFDFTIRARTRAAVIMATDDQEAF